MSAERNVFDLPDYTVGRATRFFIPIFIQSLSQALTYPLVAAIVSHGPNGVTDYAAFSQGQSVMGIVAALAGGLLTTGMVYAKTREGYATFRILNALMTLAVICVQALACFAPFDTIIFHTFLGLDGAVAETARMTLLFSIPMQFLFFVRNVGLALLYNARMSKEANWGTLGRIVLTAALSPLFIRMGWVGYSMGIVAMTGPLIVETGLVRYWSGRLVRQLPVATERVAPLHEMYMFTLPLSFSGILLSLTSFMIAAILPRAAEPARMLAIHYVTMGIINPIAYAALRVQTVAISFPPKSSHDYSVFRFCFGVGCVMAVVPLLGQIPCVAQWYFGTVQNLPAVDIPLAQRAMLVVTILPLVQAIRGHAEGLAAVYKVPNAILAGQAVNLATLVCVLLGALTLNVAGYMMGVYAILAATVMTVFTVRLGLYWALDTRARGECNGGRDGGRV